MQVYLEFGFQERSLASRRRMKKPKLSGKRYSPLPDIYTPIDKTSIVYLLIARALSFAAKEITIALPLAFLGQRKG